MSNNAKQSVGNIIGNVSNINTNCQSETAVNKRSGGYFWLLIANVIFAIINLCCAFPRSGELDFDFTGFIIATLAVLVTALVGWQVYNSIDYKGKINEISSSTKQLQNEKLASLFVGMVHLGDSIKSLPTTTDEQKQTIHDNALKAYFYALVYLHEDIPSEVKNELYNETIQNLKTLFKECGDATLSASPELQGAFYMAALKTKDTELIKYAQNIKIQL